MKTVSIPGFERCPQCWKTKPSPDFVNRAGYTVKRCQACRDKYRGWQSMTIAEKEAATSSRAGLNDAGPLRLSLVLSSKNRKTGEIPVSMTSAGTCPPSCGFYGKGCYAEQHLLGMHWRKLSDGEGLSWGDFCQAVRELPLGQLWRHNEAGDLPGDGDVIDVTRFLALVIANHGRRGFTYTHKPMRVEDMEPDIKQADALRIERQNRAVVEEANRNGFTVNLSADTLEQADALAELGIAPVVVTIPHDTPRRAGLRSPAGRHVVVCPADGEKVTCASCQLCTVRTRKSIVGFPAHGNRKQMVTKKLRQLPMFPGV